ncbi:hypothetical protein P0082_01050 [Candidatus Haliotispira prima]|uniref:Carboxypeptidase n=1 Tax=Candidatus Haliotispira prima TaxID=3034016 RepID=A0ABY8MI08_9SPIO|nr:hypothetical protein P0082_01050 [Candidatus Haliotispira prima]
MLREPTLELGISQREITYIDKFPRYGCYVACILTAVQRSLGRKLRPHEINRWYGECVSNGAIAHDDRPIKLNDPNAWDRCWMLNRHKAFNFGMELFGGKYKAVAANDKNPANVRIYRWTTSLGFHFTYGTPDKNLHNPDTNIVSKGKPSSLRDMHIRKVQETTVKVQKTTLKVNMNLGHTKNILAVCEENALSKQQKAYVLATAFWETARTMKPVIEAFWLSEEWRKINLKKYYPWYGRGYVQLTHEENYIRASRILDLDISKYKEWSVDPDDAAKILVIGSLNGWFTGKKLANYISEGYCNYKEARRIINGVDRAEEIAEIAKDYEEAL